MNYHAKLDFLKNVKLSFKPNYSEGCVKLTLGESLEHAECKLKVMYYLKLNNYKVFSEVTFKNQSRADLVAYHLSGRAIIIEIQNSESNESLKEKIRKYPSFFEFLVVNCKDFDYQRFKI